MLIKHYYSFYNMTVVLKSNDSGLLGVIDSILGDIKSDCADYIIAVISAEFCDGYYVFKERNRAFIKCKDIQLAALEITSSIVNKFVHNSNDLLYLHAGAVQKDDKVFVLVGESRSGKTSLVSVLINQYGYSFLSDEIVPIKINEGVVLPFYRALSIRKETLNFLKVDRFTLNDFSTIDNEKVNFISYKVLGNGIDENNMHNKISAIIFPHFGYIDGIKRFDVKAALAKTLETSVNFRRIVDKGFDFIIELIQRVNLYDLSINNINKAAKCISELFEQGD